MTVFTETVELKDGVSAPAKAASAAVASLQSSAVTAQGSLSKVSASTSKLDASASKTQVSVSSLASAEDGASTSSGGLQLELAELTGGLSIVAEALGVAALGIGALVFEGSKLAISASESRTKLVTMFDALGEGKITGDQTIAMLDSLSSTLGISKDQIIPYTKAFVSMGITGEDALKKITTAALSAQAIMTDPAAGEAFVQLTKKMNSAANAGQAFKVPIKGLGSLQTIGLGTAEDFSGLAKTMGFSATELGAKLKAGLNPADAKKFGDAMQDALIRKGAGPLEELGLTSENIKKVLVQNLTEMFELDEVKGFMKEVKSLFAIFDKAKPSGDAMKQGVGLFFKQVFTVATKVVPMVKHFLLDMIIYGLKAYIALKPIVKGFFVELSKEATKAWAIVKTFATALAPVIDWIKSLASNQVVVDAFWMALKGIGIIIGTIVVAVVAVVVVAALMIGALLAIQVAIVAVGAIIVGFVSSAVGVLGDWVAGAAKAAYDFVAGLVQGISSGASAVVNAVKGLAGAAKNAFTSALGIKSPSKVMMGLGVHVAGGAAEGIEAGTKDVHGAASGMADAAVKGATGDGASPSSGGGGGKSTVINVAMQIDGAGKSALEITQEMVAMVFERAALAAGAG